MSPGRTLLGSIAAGATIRPTPAVLMNMPSALPRSTTLVSPVTSRTRAVAAASRIDIAIRRKVVIGSPSSRIKPTLR
jgi:hypothetical protein